MQLQRAVMRHRVRAAGAQWHRRACGAHETFLRGR